MEMAYKIVCWPILLLLAAMLFACLIRAVKGPRMADRIVAVNMMGAMGMGIISIMAFFLKKRYLVDICLIYAMVSFLAVVVLSKVYVGIFEEMRRKMDDSGFEKKKE